MAEDNETPPPDEEAQKGAFKALFKEALTEYIEENKPDPKRTEKPKGSFLDSILNFGG